MATVDVFNSENKVVSKVDLSEAVFRAPVREHEVLQVVRMQLANRRAGTASTKNRAAVAGSRRKPWRQKGTGRARAGTRQSPLWRGGGVVFGPSPRDFGFKVNRKVRKAALRGVLTQKLQDGNLKIVDRIELAEISTRRMVEFLDHLGAQEALIVIPERDEVVEKSDRNIPGVKVTSVEGLNVYDVLRYRDLIVVQESLPRIEQRTVG